MLEPDLSVVEVRSFFVRKRNALLVRGRMSPLYLDYYLHLMQHQLKVDDAADGMLKDLLAALTLHLCSRPQDETVAWTVNVQEPLMNLFVAGSSRPGRVTGRVFTEDVRRSDTSLFVEQSVRKDHRPRQSMVDMSTTDMLKAVEGFYSQSEQRLTRLFRLDEEEFLQVSAEPDCDEEWLAGLQLEDVLALPAREHLTLLETRGYLLECGCSPERLYPMISRLPEEDLTYVFEEGFAAMQCPRCAARYQVSREMFDDWKRAQE